jgi:hypothetical protein
VPTASAVELGRFVLLNEVEANAESHFLGRAFDILRSRGILGVVTLSDPVPRHSVAGDLILPGHCGIAFQAHNGIYLVAGDIQAEDAPAVPAFLASVFAH